MGKLFIARKTDGTNYELFPIPLTGEVTGDFLPLTGGTVSGNIILKKDDIDATVIPSSQTFSRKISFTDKNDVQLASLRCSQNKNGILSTALVAEREINGELVFSPLYLQIDADGNSFALIPDITEKSPSSTAVNIASGDNRYVKKSGDEMTGVLQVKLSDSASILDEELTPSIPAFEMVDKDAWITGRVASSFGKNGTARTQLISRGNVSGEVKFASIEVLYNTDINSGYAICPNPRHVYNSDIVNNTRLIDFAHQKLTEDNIPIYVGNVSGASDTADIHNGRGFSEDKPFASILAALKYVETHLNGPFQVVVNLLSDVTLQDVDFRFENIFGVIIKGKGVNRTLNIKNVNLRGGHLQFSSNLILQTLSDTAYIVTVDGSYANSSLIMAWGPTEINGAVSDCVFSAGYSGQIIIANRNSLTGNITGRRFSCHNNGFIYSGGKGANAIPGTEAGTIGTNDGSVYA